ncbi:type VII secretion protein EccCa [Actinomyces sp. zg328]|uniref:type VII secretion protein EccCa n=1 Tax=Actinomyces sp. zg328 TaxID=2609287 RepID=UPI0013588037|nr:type VII secretion protein EccCa [Actinomyces sp. zg328]
MIEVVHRPGRVVAPVEPPEAALLPIPPQLTDTGVGQPFPFQMLLPLAGAGSSMLMMTVMRGNPIFAMLGAVVMVVTMLGMGAMMISRRSGQGRQRRERRDHYLDELSSTDSQAAARSAQYREDLFQTQPDPSALVIMARAPERRWERRLSDGDFLHLRLGIADLPVPMVRIPGGGAPPQIDPLLMTEAQAVLRRHSVQRGLPAALDLDCAGDVSIIGPRDSTAAIARALLAQAAVLHAPEDLLVALAHEPERASAWDCAARLPHLRVTGAFDGPIALRRVAPDHQELERLLRPDIAAATKAVGSRGSWIRTGFHGPRLLVVSELNGPARALSIPDQSLTPGDIGITTLHLVEDRLDEPSSPSWRLTVTDDGVLVEDLRAQQRSSAPMDPSAPDTAQPFLCEPDAVGPALMEGLARALAPHSLGAAAHRHESEAATTSLSDLLGVADPRHVDTHASWAKRPLRDFLRVPIGSDDDGKLVLLDIKESAQLGVGPHGLCIGATGSGKSELLRTLIAVLATTHSPDDLSMILVDYKGGAAFAPFATMPHVVGLMDNLADDAGLTERARSSIAGEVLRRQEQLRDAGNSPDIGHYRHLRESNQGMAPMPHLFVIIDEFGELLTANPDFIDLLLTIGRIGRSIGVHLLLASQRIEAGKLRGLDTYLSYRLCLRTFTESESATVIGNGDAFHLPSAPGYGYLKVDTSIYTRFRSGFVSGPLDELDDVPEPEEITERRPLLLPVYNELEAGSEGEAGADIGEPLPETRTIRATVVDSIVNQLSQAAPANTPVWLEPLPRQLSLTGMYGGELSRRPGQPPRAPDGLWDPPGLTVPIGLVDDPAHQRQDIWDLDLTVGGGHIALMGAPQSGRTTFLMTLATSAALALPPSRLSFYGIDATGGGLSRLSHLPNVGGIATRGDRERMRRVLDEIVAMLDQRERIIAANRIDSLEMMRLEHRQGRVDGLASADVVLLIDGIGLIRADFPELEDGIDELIRRGGGLGVHIVTTLARANDLKMAQQPLFGTRLELRLNDPADSLIARKLSQTLAPDAPGRVLRPDKLFGHLALPIERIEEDRGVGAALDGLAEEMNASWTGSRPMAVRQLPDVIDPATLPDDVECPDQVPLGIFQDTMSPLQLDLGGADPHLLVFGDARCGKSTVLRGIVEGLVARSTPEELVLGVYDVRRDVARACPEPYLGGHATSSTTAGGLSAAIATELDRRAALIAEGKEADGPRIVLVIDDYDILSSGGTNILSPIVPHLPSARDLRLNVIVARPTAGASHAMYDPVLLALRDNGGTGFLMDGDRLEGVLLGGVRPARMPPGRGNWVQRGRRPRIAQAAYFAPEA